MKLQNVLFACVLIGLTSTVHAQKSGIIKYSNTTKLEIEVDESQTGGIDISGFLPPSTTSYSDLSFANNQSIYVRGQDEIEDQTFENEDATIQIEIGGSDTEEIFYHDFDNGEFINQTGFMGKEFLIVDEIEKITWKLTGEKLKYLGYECIKATSSNEEGDEIVAWFAPAIPCKVGPAHYGQLPGAILMLSIAEDQDVFKATEVILSDDVTIKKPKKGKKVTEVEYEKIVEEKMKEMHQSMGKNTLIIRG